MLIICFAFYATLNQMLELLQFSVLLKKNFVRIRNDTCENVKYLRTIKYSVHIVNKLHKYSLISKTNFFI